MFGGQNKSWAPYKVCQTCLECLWQWKNGQRKYLIASIPMVSKEPTNHHNDRYICVVNGKVFKRNKKSK